MIIVCVWFFIFYFGQIKIIVNKSKGEQYIQIYRFDNAGRKNGKEKEKSNKYMQHQTCKVSNTKTTSKLESFHLPTRVTL